MVQDKTARKLGIILSALDELEQRMEKISNAIDSIAEGQNNLGQSLARVVDLQKEYAENRSRELLNAIEASFSEEDKN